jgi:hypothetical protein
LSIGGKKFGAENLNTDGKFACWSACGAGQNLGGWAGARGSRKFGILIGNFGILIGNFGILIGNFGILIGNFGILIGNFGILIR